MKQAENEKNKDSTDPKSKREQQGFNSKVAAEALAEGLIYIKSQWALNGRKIGQILHLPTTTINYWMRLGKVPITNEALSPEVQAVVHLISIQRSLGTMFSKSNLQVKWLNTIHPNIGEAPLKKMSESLDGLIFIRQYLDYVRGRGA